MDERRNDWIDRYIANAEISNVTLTAEINDFETIEIPINAIAGVGDLYERIGEEWRKIQGNIDDKVMEMAVDAYDNLYEEGVDAIVDRERGK